MFGIELFDGYISLFILFLTIGLYIYWGTRRPPGIPPGPTPFPLVGNIPALLGADTRDAFAKLRLEYGDIFSLCIGNVVLVVVNGMDIMREMFVKNGDVFSERPHMFYTSLTRGLGIINANGDGWKEQRRFALSTLRDFGMGRGKMEDRISTECQVCLDEFEEKHETPFDPNHVIGTSVSNVMCLVMFGKSFAHDDPVFQKYLTSMHDSAKKVSNTSVMHFFPLLSYFATRSLKKKDDVVRGELICREVAEHQESFDIDNPRDFIDAYLRELKLNEDKGVKNSFHLDNLIQVISEFFFAGTETTTTTLLWALLYMALNPDYQRAAQEEIDSVILSHRNPTSNDKKQLPLTEAIILETQRLGDVVPFSVPHGVAEETILRGYRIPTNAIILPNLSSVLKDKALWGDPDVFRPQRFLDPETKVIKPEYLIPFSLGKRTCLGESLAKMELFIFLTKMLQSFTYSLPETDPSPCLQGHIGITRMPHPYKIIATKR